MAVTQQQGTTEVGVGMWVGWNNCIAAEVGVVRQQQDSRMLGVRVREHSIIQGLGWGGGGGGRTPERDLMHGAR